MRKIIPIAGIPIIGVSYKSTNLLIRMNDEKKRSPLHQRTRRMNQCFLKKPNFVSLCFSHRNPTLSRQWSHNECKNCQIRIVFNLCQNRGNCMIPYYLLFRVLFSITRRRLIKWNHHRIVWTDLALPLEREMTCLMMWIWSLPWSEILVRALGSCAERLAVGKTCLLNRYIQGTFSSEFYTTIVGKYVCWSDNRELTIVRRLRQSMTKYAVLRYSHPIQIAVTHRFGTLQGRSGSEPLPSRTCTTWL